MPRPPTSSTRTRSSDRPPPPPRRKQKRIQQLTVWQEEPAAILGSQDGDEHKWAIRANKPSWPAHLLDDEENALLLLGDEDIGLFRVAEENSLLLGAKDIALAEILAELDRREGVSGLEEKASRQKQD